MKAKILRDDPSRRFKAGEIGEVLENDFPEKYDYLIRLQGTVRIDNLLGCGITDVIRKFYFYVDEIELIKEEN